MDIEQVNIAWRQISVPTKMACGARKPVRTTKGALRFQVESKPQRFIEIYLDRCDLYEVEYFRVKRGSCEKVSIDAASDVGCEELSEVIYHMVNR